MNCENKYRDFLDNELPSLIADGVSVCFSDMDTDPEAAWSTFRDGLRKLKKKHKELFIKYGESDVEEPLPKSELTKWREVQALKESNNKAN